LVKLIFWGSFYPNLVFLAITSEPQALESQSKLKRLWF